MGEGVYGTCSSQSICDNYLRSPSDLALDMDMKRSVKLVSYSAGSVVALVCAFLVWVSWPVSIEGSWSGYATKCMCESYNFLRFEDGKISQYSNIHSTHFDIGEYTQQEGGRYTIKIYEVKRESYVLGEENIITPEKTWEVVPRRYFLRHPYYEYDSEPLIPVAEFLFPVPPWKNADKIMETAEERDAKNEREWIEHERLQNEKSR